MNHIYRVIFNRQLGIFQVVGELAKSACKSVIVATPSSLPILRYSSKIKTTVFRMAFIAALGASFSTAAADCTDPALVAAGISITEDGRCINTSGHAALASQGGLITLSNSKIETTDLGIGLFAYGQDSRITGTDLVLNGSGLGSMVTANPGTQIDLTRTTIEGAGLEVLRVNDARATLNNVTIQSNNLQLGVGVRINGALGMGSSVQANDTTITVLAGDNRGNGWGYNITKGSLQAQRGKINSNGGGVYIGDGGRATFENTEIISENYHAAQVDKGQLYFFNDGNSLKTRRDDAYALWTTDWRAQVISHNTAVETLGAGSIAIAAQGGEIYLINNTISTQGARAYGVYSDAFNERYQQNAGNFHPTASISVSSSSVTTTGRQAYGIYAARAGQASVGQASISTQGVLSHGLFGTSTETNIEAEDSTITTQGDNAYGALAANGASVALSGGAVTTHGGYTAGASLFAASGLIANGNSAAAGNETRLQAENVAVSTGDVNNSTTAGANAYGALAYNGGILNISGGSVTTHGQGATGLYSQGIGGGFSRGAQLNAGGDIRVETFGDNAYGAQVAEGATLRLNGSVLNTHGENAYGALMSGQTGQQLIFTGDNRISTEGANAHGISLQEGASQTFSGVSLLPTITVSGEGSALLHAASTSATSTLILAGNTSLDIANASVLNRWGAKAEAGGEIRFTENSRTNGVGLWASAGTLVLDGDAQASGSRVKLDNGGILDVRGANFASVSGVGSLEGDADTTVRLSNALVVGNTNSSNGGSLLDNAEFSGRFEGSGDFIKTGELTQILSGRNNSVNNVSVQNGTLRFTQEGAFTANNFRTLEGGTTDIGAINSTLVVNNEFRQDANSRLVATLGSSPEVTTRTAVLDGELSIKGFNLTDVPNRSSVITDPNYSYTLIRATEGIRGGFTNNPLDGFGLDYLQENGFIVNNGLSATSQDYRLGFNLSWTSGTQLGTGSFTLAEGTGFTVDESLVTQAGPFASGWDGDSLTKAGLGQLTLAAINVYFGRTTIAGGTLALAEQGDISASNEVNLTGETALFSLNRLSNLDTRVNNLNGVAGSRVELGDIQLFINNSDPSTGQSVDSEFAGVIQSSSGLDNGAGGLTQGSGSVTKIGAGMLTLTGRNTYSGLTYIQEGTLKISGGGSVSGEIRNEGTLIMEHTDSVNHTTYHGKIYGGGSLIKTGSGVGILRGLSSNQESLEVREGTLSFQQDTNQGATPFTVDGDFTIKSGAVAEIGSKGSTLKTGQFFHEANALLRIIPGAMPDITATTAVLAGELTLESFESGLFPVRASSILTSPYTLVHTTDGITGDFSNTVGSDFGIDYLLERGRVSADRKDYNIDFRLAWTEGGKTEGTGDFTINAEDASFDVDLALHNQTAQDGSFDSQWDGTTLNKKGAGSLVLSAENSYSGATTVESGTLFVAGAGSIQSSSQLDLTSDSSVFDLSFVSSTSTTVNNLSGVAGSKVVLSGTNDNNQIAKTLVVNSDAATHFAGDIEDNGLQSSLSKEGEGTLTLSGKTTYTGDTKVNKGRLVLDGSNGGAQLTSNIIGQAGSSISLTAGAKLTGWIDPTDVTVDRASQWEMTNDSLLSSLTLAGKVNFSNPGNNLTKGRTLTTTNLIGNGGVINLYTALGGNNCISDKIVIDGGRASGTTVLHISNAGGLGDSTDGNGINVVQTINNGSTEKSAFSLSNEEGVVNAGAYSYSLVRGGEGAENDWFLTNHTEGKVNYSANTSLLRAKHSQAQRYEEITLGTLSERMGDLQALNKKSDGLAWGRIVGKRYNNHFDDHSVASKGSTSAVQLGSDFYVNRRNKSRTSIGAFLTLGQSRFDVAHTTTTGEKTDAGDNNLKAFGVAGYLTRLADNGSYLDAVLQATHFNLSNQPPSGSISDHSALGVSASVEMGRRFRLSSGYSVEPQAQMVLQTLKINDVKVSEGSNNDNVVRFDRSNTMALRIGTRFSKEWGSDKQDSLVLWMTPNVIQQIGRDTQIRFGTPSQGELLFEHDLPGTRLSLQTGVDGYVSKQVALNARLGLDRTLNGAQQTSYSGELGVKVGF